MMPSLATARPTAPVGLVEMDPLVARGHRSSTSRGHGVRFPLPKNPKVDVLMFNGSGDIFNLFYQMEHLFSIHEIPIEQKVEFLCFI